MSSRYLSTTMHAEDAASLAGAPLFGVELRIYNDLWNAIIDRKLRPDVKLDETELCEIYGISRTVVRKVLVIMEQEGIVTLPLNRGAYVAHPSPQQALEAVEVTYAMLAYVVGKLAANSAKLTAEQRNRLNQHLAAEQASIAEDDFGRGRRLRVEFVVLLALVYGNRTLAATLERHATRLALALTVYQEIPTPFVLTGQIMQLIDAGQPMEAIAYVEDFGKTVVGTMNLIEPTDTVDLKAILVGNAHGVSRDEKSAAARVPISKRYGPRKLAAGGEG